MLATMKKVWGEPKEEEYGKKLYVFSEEPFIAVKDSVGCSRDSPRAANSVPLRLRLDLPRATDAVLHRDERLPCVPTSRETPSPSMLV